MAVFLLGDTVNRIWLLLMMMMLMLVQLCFMEAQLRVQLANVTLAKLGMLITTGQCCCCSSWCND